MTKVDAKDERVVLTLFEEILVHPHRQVVRSNASACIHRHVNLALLGTRV